MIDRLFAAALTFAVLTGATLAIASELWPAAHRDAPVVQLERVVIVGKRVAQAAPLAQADALKPTAQSLQ